MEQPLKQYRVQPERFPHAPITVYAPSFVDALFEAKRIFGLTETRETLVISRVLPAGYGLCG